ncbi:PfkB family carbohydrate kinase [Saxibacter everestensis]|uniref:PfkB family carbohydrate kinase n=1 Tax=Saxibacter everestensis TaxID=2909229 RepID=A0ABY8QU66_9MICO|nr:PfkB family carbohydrate kinase [Brevibacteriaceae bacterium ZFBP1038]
MMAGNAPDERAAEQAPMVGEPHDPLLSLRSGRSDEPEFDLALIGTVFFDIVFTGLGGDPHPGTEVHAQGMGSCPGGTANLAVAAARLGLRTTLASAFGEDVYGDFCWETLETGERVDLSASYRVPDWHSPVTVSAAYAGDRSMMTHEHEAPVPVADLAARLPQSAAVFAPLSTRFPTWVRDRAAAGALVFADVGWDSTLVWSEETLAGLEHCHAFMPNTREAIAYTRQDDPRGACKALAERVPLAVVTRGDHGAIAIDSGTGEEAEVDGLAMDAVDPTGAGDVFGAALMMGTLAGWPLSQRLRLANLCAALSVQYIGGSLSAPGWADIAIWYAQMRAVGDKRLRSEYAFLGDLIPTQWRPTLDRRSVATIGLRTRADSLEGNGVDSE